MKKHLRLIFSVLVLIALLILPYFVFAQTNPTPPTASPGTLKILSDVATNGGYQESSLQATIGIIIKAAFSLLGAVFIILVIVGGYIWMTAEGNEQKIEKAQNYIRRAIIGLIITFSAWAIWSFVLSKFILAA
jgi:hypothetical protein